MGVILKGIGGATRLDMSSEKLEEHEEILRHLLRELETQVSHTLPTASGGMAFNKMLGWVDV